MYRIQITLIDGSVKLVPDWFDEEWAGHLCPIAPYKQDATEWEMQHYSLYSVHGL